MKARSFGFVAGASSASRENRAADLSRTEGLIEHSQRHGELATLAAVAERGAKPSAVKQTVQVVEGRNGERVVVRADDLERERNRPLPKAVQDARWANEQFLRETNPNRQAPSNEPMKRIDVGKRAKR